MIMTSERYDFMINDNLRVISDILRTCTPASYNVDLNYKQKIDLLMFLIDTAHDL